MLPKFFRIRYGLSTVVERLHQHTRPDGNGVLQWRAECKGIRGEEPNITGKVSILVILKADLQ